jgi:hypothetical protein
LLPFDDVEVAPRVAEITCPCLQCSEAVANHVNSKNRSTAEEWCNTSRSAAGVSYALNSRSTAPECWCNCNRRPGTMSGRFSGATA